MPLVGVVMGSKSDMEALKPALEILEQLGIDPPMGWAGEW